MDVVCGLTAFMVRQDFEQYPASRYPACSAEGSSVSSTNTLQDLSVQKIDDS